jgi:hypothetical protein
MTLSPLVSPIHRSVILRRSIEVPGEARLAGVVIAEQKDLL